MNVNFIKSNKGSTMVLFALMLTALMGCGALVIDIGRVSLEKSKLQNAIDASALAAVQDLPDTTKATATANEYIQLNGYSPSDIIITFSSSNTTINITGAKKVDYTLAKVLGFDSTTVNTIAAAEKGSPGGAFDCSLFSDQNIDNSGGGGIEIIVTGTTHANGNVNYTQLTSSSKFDVVEANGTVTVAPSSVTVGSKSPGVPKVVMPDYSDLIKTTAKYNYNGNKIFSGNLDVNGSIYVNGNVTLNQPNITGNGTIYATGTITLDNPQCTGTNQVCIYSDSNSNSAIITNGSKLVLNGILYAPKGGISINSNPIIITGKAIAKTRVHFEAGFSILGSGVKVNSIPGAGARLVK